jgi:DNA polymerase
MDVNLHVIDFETRSMADLERVGHAVYAANPNTDVTCGAWVRGNDPDIQLWRRGDPVPRQIIEASADVSVLFGAHNAEFEIAIWRHILTPRYGWPQCPPVERWRCSMAMARAQALPADLDLLMKAASFEHRKADSKAMRLLSKPRPPREGEPENEPCWHAENADFELFQQLYEYVKTDVACEREAFKTLPPLTPHEQQIWCIHCRINAHGFYTDGVQIAQAITVIETNKPAIKAEIVQVTGGAVQTGNQFAKIRNHLTSLGCELPNIKKHTVRAALTRPDLKPEARRLLELRREAAFASAHKFAAMRAWRGPDGRIRGAFKFHGAATGRWSGAGPQPQNLRRDDNE